MKFSPDVEARFQRIERNLDEADRMMAQTVAINAETDKKGKMINRKELAICKQRGHYPVGYREKWERCKYCGLWTRTITTKEEREDDPPEKEQDPIYGLRRAFGKPSESSGKAGRGKGKKAK